MEAKQLWGLKDELPCEVDLGPSCQFHSLFACPILRFTFYLYYSLKSKLSVRISYLFTIIDTDFGIDSKVRKCPHTIIFSLTLS